MGLDNANQKEDAGRRTSGRPLHWAEVCAVVIDAAIICIAGTLAGSIITAIFQFLPNCLFILPHTLSVENHDLRQMFVSLVYFYAAVSFADSIVMILSPLILAAGFCFVMQDWARWAQMDFGLDSVGPPYIIPAFVFLFAQVIINWLYRALLESSRKQATIGQQLMHLQVVDEQGERITLTRASLKHFSVVLCVMSLFGMERTKMLGYKIIDTVPQQWSASQPKTM